MNTIHPNQTVHVALQTGGLTLIQCKGLEPAPVDPAAVVLEHDCACGAQHAVRQYKSIHPRFPVRILEGNRRGQEIQVRWNSTASQWQEVAA
jgi:hypothetical protein